MLGLDWAQSLANASSSLYKEEMGILGDVHLGQTCPLSPIFIEMSLTQSPGTQHLPC